MRRIHIDALRSPLQTTTGELLLKVFDESDGHIVEGVLEARASDEWYPVINGVPCFLTGHMKPDTTEFCVKHGLPAAVDVSASFSAIEQSKTNKTFSDKWTRFKRYGLEPDHKDFLQGWYAEKLGLKDRTQLAAFHRDRNRILEVGPGSGFNTQFMAEHCKGQVFALDISDAAHTTFENTRHLANCCVVQADLMNAPFPDGFFDLIVADGVLHHTPDTQSAVKAIYQKLAPGGQLFFYLYKQMGAARQFSDNYIRSHFTKLSPDECYAACEGLTELGRVLSKLDHKITLSKPIPVLGIDAGEHDVHRLLYYNFVKCFWNDAFDFETNNMVNFDWYHPHNAWQHSREEVEGWLEEMGVLELQFNDANPNGLSVLIRKPELIS